MVAVAVVFLVLPGLTNALCYPDISLEECAARQAQEQSQKQQDVEVDVVSTRSSFITGRSCFSTVGYFGSCSTSVSCVRRNYSYSRTCGWDHVCCSAGQGRTTTRAPVWGRSTRTPTRRTTTTTTSAARTSSGSCGVSPVNFIYGGKEAKKGQFPFMVSFVYRYSPSYVENFCGGVLISRRHVLTAGHCFSNVEEREWRSGEVDVRIGMTDLDKAEDTLASADISKVTVRPKV
jgi:hypothetical protein